MRTALALGFAAALIWAPPALAVDRYVDEGGTNSGACTNPASPCATINYSLAQGSGDRILLGAGTYPETVSITAGEIARIPSIFAGGAGPAIIDNSVDGPSTASSPAVTVSPGTLRGVTVRSDFRPLRINGGSAIANTFDQDEPPAASAIAGATDHSPRVEVTNGAPLIQGNTFTDTASDSSVVEAAILVGPGGGPQILENRVSGFARAISLQGANTGGTPLLDGNVITGLADGAGEDAAVFVRGMGPTLVGNEISAPAGAGGIGVDVTDTAPNTTGTTVATLKRNRLIGLGTAVRAVDTSQTSGEITLSLNSDLIAKSTGNAVVVQDMVVPPPPPPQPPPPMTVTLNNVTLFDGAGAAELSLDNAAAVLDSTIVGAAGIATANTTSCTATYSRGPAAISGGCSFATTADPIFVDPAGGDYHLQPASPLIEAGNPASAAEPNAFDLDGDPRALDATPECRGDQPVRDIGADELAPPQPDCLAPNTAVAGKRRYRTRRRRARVAFRFSASEPGASFQCKLDRRRFRRCSSPFIRRVRRGRHKFQVRAIDAAGNVDPTPAVRRFRVRRVRRR